MKKIRTRIQHFRLNTNPDPGFLITKNWKIFTVLKNLKFALLDPDSKFGSGSTDLIESGSGYEILLWRVGCILKGGRLKLGSLSNCSKSNFYMLFQIIFKKLSLIVCFLVIKTQDRIRILRIRKAAFSWQNGDRPAIRGRSPKYTMFSSLRDFAKDLIRNVLFLLEPNRVHFCVFPAWRM